MIEEYSPSVSLEDLVGSGEEEQATRPVSLKTGIGESIVEAKEAEKGVDPNLVRWVFNPFEIVDLTNKPASCGILFLRNVVFNQIRSIPTNVAKNFSETTSSPTNNAHNPDNYVRFNRTAYMIARELEELAGDKGVTTVEEITGQDAATAANLNVLLFGGEIECVPDVNNPEHPCPVLPNLLEVVDANVRANSAGLDADTRAVVLNVAKRVRESIGKAIRNARLRIDEAQKRILDDKNPNRTLSHAEQRCYLALGEEVPNQMPFLSRTAASNINRGNSAGIDANALAQAVVAGVRAAQPAASPAAPVATVKVPIGEMNNDVDAETAIGSPKPKKQAGAK